MSIQSIILAVLGISILVIIHEGGHYLAARAFGMRVLKYSIGFGPTLIKHKPKGSETTFQLCAIPFLAYVQIAGMNPTEEIDENDPALYPNQGVLARIITIFAGPFANYLTASLLVFTLGVSGWPEERPVEPMQIAQVAPKSPAASAGLQVGDTLVMANGKKIRNVEALIKVTGPRAGTATRYVVERAGKRLELTITPKDQAGRGVIGVVAKTARIYQPMSVGKALRASVVFPYQLTVSQLKELGSRIRQGSSEGVSGPVGIGKLVAQQAGQGWVEYLSVLMLLSVALGMFNLLPFPALDGGRLMFLGYELLTRRRPNERFEAVVHTVGIVILIGLLVLITIRDVTS